jgi:hypothetical protein
MKRRTLDILFSIGGLALAFLFVTMGMVMTSNANFSKKYVHDQLIQQKITFKAASALTAEEKQAPCLVKYAGQQLQTGKQAECYANNFIGLHVKSIANGGTYATLGDTQNTLKAQIAAAQQAGDNAKVADLNTQLNTVNTQRTTLFQGETLRGLLLTSYGFSTLGLKGGQAATVSYIAAGLLFILSVFGFVHAFRTPKAVAFAAVDEVDESAPKPMPTNRPVTA